MRIVDIKDGVFLPNLGLAAASFGAFLTILNLAERSSNLKSAVSDFAIGIPLTIACYFLVGTEKKFPIINSVILWVNSIFVIAGTAFCLMGLQSCFHEIHPPAGETFKFMAIFIFGMVLIGGLIQIFAPEIKENKDKSKPND